MKREMRYLPSEAKRLVEMGFVVERDQHYQVEYRYVIVSPKPKGE
jgi:hypothetical protein